MFLQLLDTTQHKDTLGTFVSDLVLQVLSIVAEKEREDINKRQREGIDSAKAKGKHLGRPRMNLESLTEQQRIILNTIYDFGKGRKYQKLILGIIWH